MLPFKAVLAGVLGASVLAISISAYAVLVAKKDVDIEPSGYAVLACIGEGKAAARIDPEFLLITAGTNPDIDAAGDQCDEAVEKFLAAGWRLHLVSPHPSAFQGENAHEDHIFYHFVSS